MATNWFEWTVAALLALRMVRCLEIVHVPAHLVVKDVPCLVRGEESAVRLGFDDPHPSAEPD